MKQTSELAILYLSKHFRKKTTLQELAKSVGLSPFHFHRIFVAENNCTPQNYLEKIRMEHAQHIMGALPNWSITDIAFECGYSSPGIFSRAFKKYYGFPPSKYKPDVITIPADLENKLPLNIQYLSSKTIWVKKVKLINKKLNLAYQEFVSNPVSNNTIYGVFLDPPFHKPIEECRYFMGIESSKSKKTIPTLEFPAGYFVSISINGDFKHLKEKAVALNHQIQKKGYVIDSLIGYEKIKINKDVESFDYMNATREVLMKIKRE